MSQPYVIPLWKTAPFIRLLLPLVCGIVIQWYICFSLSLIICTGFGCFSILCLLYFLKISKKYKLRTLQGVLLQLILLFAGSFMTWKQDIRNNSTWFGNIYNDSTWLVVRINEPPVQKEKTCKAEGYVESVVAGEFILPVQGNILLYFAKDSLAATLRYGDKILINKSLQPIKNTGNPGAFNYRRYAAFQQVYHTVYLHKNDFVVLHEKNVQPFMKLIYTSRDRINAVLQNFLSKDKSIIGIAEALMIGYKEDLDKDLVQAYSNTGVVHIIAISGLHLGLIYFMLSWIFNRLPLLKRNATVKVILILGCLWFFAILTGGSASVLRSAVMFSCILIGSTYFKQTSIYNSLASSAFILLCFDPYFLWDVGFQLSYMAVIGIVWLQQPIFHLLYMKNKWLNKIWSMASVTIAAQIAAFPICIYYFHQFPNLFLVTNMIVVPLSTVILFAEIFLLCFSWSAFIGTYAGKIITLLIQLMNDTIRLCSNAPYSLYDKIYADIATTWLLYGIVIFFCSWLLYRNKKLILFSISCMVPFVLLHAWAKSKSYSQQKIIVYNIPGSQAIDIITGNTCYFIGDSSLRQGGAMQNFHLKPARMELQTTESHSIPSNLQKQGDIWKFNDIRIVVIDKAVPYKPISTPVPVDLLILSKNPSLKIGQIITALKPAIIIFDASNSLWKIAQWKKECSVLLLRFHSVPERGAFVFDINQAL